MVGNSPFVILSCEKMKKKSLYYENDAFFDRKLPDIIVIFALLVDILEYIMAVRKRMACLKK